VCGRERMRGKWGFRVLNRLGDFKEEDFTKPPL